MNYTVLVVDDDEVFLFIHKQLILLSKFHESPQTFNSAENALEYITNLPDKSKTILMFLDINMPNMSSWDLLSIIHQGGSYKEVYVVMVTSSVEIEDKEKALTFSQVIGFIEKPLKVGDLQKLKVEQSWI